MEIQLNEIINSVIALGTLGAAVAAWLAAKATKISAQSDVFKGLISQYSTPEMASNLRILRKWRLDSEDDLNLCILKFKEALQHHNHNLHKEARKVDSARRFVLYYFISCHHLLENKAINEKLYKILVNEETAEILIKVAVPLTEVRRSRESRHNQILNYIESQMIMKQEDPLSKDWIA